MSTFGLVHGAWHGAWSWDLLAPELARRGHSVVAMDLPCEDHDATFSDYAAAVDDALGAAGDVVLVGHSMGGMTVPLVALRRPVRLMVFLCALVPDRPGNVDRGAPATHPRGAFDALVRHDDGSTSWPDAEHARTILYSDCLPELAARAFKRLRRQQNALWDRLQPIERWPDTPLASIHCRSDRCINPEWSTWVATRRLGVESIELPGGHSPMLARPAVLARALVRLAEAVPSRASG